MESFGETGESHIETPLASATNKETVSHAGSNGIMDY